MQVLTTSTRASFTLDSPEDELHPDAMSDVDKAAGEWEMQLAPSQRSSCQTVHHPPANDSLPKPNLLTAAPGEVGTTSFSTFARGSISLALSFPRRWLMSLSLVVVPSDAAARGWRLMTLCSVLVSGKSCQWLSTLQ